MLLATHALSIAADTALQPLILVIEPDADLLASRVRLLTRSEHAVTTAKNAREIVTLECVGGVQIALISDSLELAQLRACAECVRMQWPTARILILGCVDRRLEDYLYDESIASHFDPKTLLETLTSLNQAVWKARSSIHATRSRNR